MFADSLIAWIPARRPERQVRNEYSNMNLQAYYAVLKPERTYVNIMTTAAGFLFACKWHISWELLVSTLLGSTFIVMSACAANNATDRNLDARMPRTNKRALVVGDIPVRTVIALSVVLGLAGFTILALFVNWLTVLLGAIGYIDYVVLYAWSKRTTPHSTLIGTISGAVPITAGYTAVTNHFDTTAILLALILISWQMAHFYAIGIYRHKDYAAGKLPIWPVRYGDANTRSWIIAYTALFLICSVLLVAAGSAGNIYLVCMTALGVYWLYKALKGLRSPNLTLWARQFFLTSLVVILATSVLVSVGSVLS